VKGRDDALVSARSRVSAQVSASVSSTASRLVKDWREGSRRGVDVVNVVQMEQRTSFTHAELIEPKGETVTLAGTTRQLACLDRQQAQRVLEQELTSSLATFESRARNALQAREKGDYAAFTASFREATAESERCVPLVFQVATLAGGQADLSQRFWGQLKALTEAAADVRSGVRVGVKVEAPGFPDDVRQQLSRSVCEAVQSDDLTCVPAPDCGGVTHLVTVTGEANCRFGGLGHTCQPQVSLHGTECRTRRQAFLSPYAGPVLKGTNVKDEEKALRKALGNITADVVRAWVVQSLSREIPMRAAPPAGGASS
jgi:hypothetical protein